MTPTASRIASVILIAALLVIAWLVMGCAHREFPLPDGPDTTQKFDRGGKPNFGQR